MNARAMRFAVALATIAVATTAGRNGSAIADGRKHVAPLALRSNLDIEGGPDVRTFDGATFDTRRLVRRSADGACTFLVRYPVVRSVLGQPPAAETDARLRAFATVLDDGDSNAATDPDALGRCAGERRAQTAAMRTWPGRGAGDARLERSSFSFDAVAYATFARGGFASVRRIAMTNICPSAHPSTTHATLLIDLRTGRTYGYDAVFRGDRISIAALDALVRAKLHRFDPSLDDAPRHHHLVGIGGSEGYDADFTPSGIDIANIFDFHAAAGVGVTVSRGELARAGVVRTDGPLRALLGD